MREILRKMFFGDTFMSAGVSRLRIVYVIICINGLAAGIYLAGFHGLLQAGFPPELHLAGLGGVVLALALGLLLAWASWFLTRMAGERWLGVDSQQAGWVAALCDLPWLILPLGLILYPLIHTFGSGLSLDILGQVRFPWQKEFINLPPPGYILLLWAGPAWTLPCFLKMLWGVKKMLARARAPEGEHALGRGRNLFFIAVVFYLALGVWTTSIYPPTGDEPHYLLMTHSLGHEGDLDLTDNMQQKDFQEFYPAAELDFHHASPPEPGSRMISKHFPLVSLIILPGYALLGRMGAVFIIILFASTIGLSLYHLGLGFGFSRSQAITAWAVAVLSMPLAVYFDLIYTELPAALVLLLGVWFWFQGGRRGVWGTALAAGLLPWLYPKYIVLSALLGILWLFTPRIRIRNFLLPGLAVLISGLGFIYFFNQLYGLGLSDNPFGTFSWPWSRLGLRNALGLLIDRNFGILPNSPALILGLAGLWLFYRKNRTASIIITGIFLAQYLLYVSFDDFSGSSAVFSRQMIPGTVLLLLVIPAGWERARELGPVTRIIAGVMVLAGIGYAWLYAAWPVLRYLSPKLKLWNALGFTPSLFPGFLPEFGAGTALWGGAWLAGIGYFIWYLTRSRRN